jgi:hypothetical protein
VKRLTEAALELALANLEHDFDWCDNVYFVDDSGLLVRSRFDLWFRRRHVDAYDDDNQQECIKALRADPWIEAQLKPLDREALRRHCQLFGYENVDDHDDNLELLLIHAIREIKEDPSNWPRRPFKVMVG